MSAGGCRCSENTVQMDTAVIVRLRFKADRGGCGGGWRQCPCLCLGSPNTTDVVYSRQFAKTLGFPWKRIDLPDNFLEYNVIGPIGLGAAYTSMGRIRWLS